MRGWRWGNRGAWVCAVVGWLALGACEPWQGEGAPWEAPGEAPLGTLSQEVSSTLTFVAAADATALAADTVLLRLAP